MEKPKIGDYLYFKKIGLLKVKERGVFVREPNRNPPNQSEYSIMEDLNGNVIKNDDGNIAFFYDVFLTVDNFKVIQK